MATKEETKVLSDIVEEAYDPQKIRKELNDLLPKMMKLGGTLVVEFDKGFADETDEPSIRIHIRHPKTGDKYGLAVNPEKDASFVDWFIAGVTATLRLVSKVKTD